MTLVNPDSGCNIVLKGLPSLILKVGRGQRSYIFLIFFINDFFTYNFWETLRQKILQNEKGMIVVVGNLLGR